MKICTLRNEICTLRNENLYFAKWNLYFAKWKRRSQNLGPRTKRKHFFRACLPRIASAKLALSIVLSPPLLTALGGPALLCFVTRWLHKFDISTQPNGYANNSDECSRSLCWVNVAWRKCMYNERTCYSNNHKDYNFLACDWFKNVLFSTNSLAKLLSDSLLLDSLLLDSLLLDSLISQSHSKM